MTTYTIRRFCELTRLGYTSQLKKSSFNEYGIYGSFARLSQYSGCTLVEAYLLVNGMPKQIVWDNVVFVLKKY